MSQYLYDQALVEKLRIITKDTNITIVTPEETISYLAQVSEDRVRFPAIILTRGPATLLDYQNQYATLKGQTAFINEDSTVKKLKLINMRLQWSLNVYAVDRYTCDEIIRELVFFFVTYPRFEVKVPYGLDIIQNFDVFLENDIADNTDLVEFPNKGEYFRTTLTLYTENAHLFSARDQMTTYTKADVDTNSNKIINKEMTK